VNWEALGAAGEVVGAVAVVISLVYLALQLRTNSRTLRANGSWSAEMSWADLNDKTAHDPEYSLLVSKAASPEANLADFNESEQAQLWFSFLSVFQTTQAQYFMWKDGCLSDEVWNYRSSWFRSYILIPLVGVFWQQTKSQNLLSTDFITEIELERGKEHYVPYVDAIGAQSTDREHSGT
jgi:hypothetical protein